MLKILLKKQFLELKASYFRNKRNNKKNSKIADIGFGVLLAFLYVSLCMAFVAIGAGYISAVEALNVRWLYFSLFGISVITVGTIITMFYSMSILYNAKDNELLLSLPVKTKDIVLSRIIVLYFNTLIFTSFIWLPALVVYLARFGFDLIIVISAIILWLALSAIVLVLASIFGYLVASISKRFKGKSYISTLLTVLFLIAYYYLYFNLTKYLEELNIHIHEIELFVKDKLLFFYLIGKAGTGDIKNLLLIVFVAALFCFTCIYVINKNFSSIIKDSNSVTKTKNRKIEIKQTSIKDALIKKELKHFLSNTTYTMNCGLGILFIVVGTIALPIYKNDLLINIEVFKQFLPIDKLLPVLILAIVVGMSSMNALATPSVSLEGNTYWITRSLPVSTYEILDAKRTLQFRLNVIPSIVFVVVATYVFNIKDITQVLLVLASATFISFTSFYDLFLGIKGANLNWTSEVVPIKQSINVLIAVLSSFAFTFIIGYGYYFLVDKIASEIYLSLIVVISLGLSKLLDSWLKTKGVKEYENL